MSQLRVSLMLLIGFCLLIPGRAAAQGLEVVQATYTKYEFRIPMRDGKKLFTAVYVPKDDSQTYPILMKRTPYNVKPYGVDQYPAELGPSPLFAKDGYIFVYQDVRGRWMSEGEMVNMRPHLAKKGPQDVDESTDTWDTIDWLVKHIPGNNGKVGQWGVSYPGFYTAAGMIDAHPALKAASPQAPITDWFVGDDWHHNGAVILPHFFNFMAKFGRPRPGPTKKFDHPFDHETPDGYDFFLRMGPLANANAKYFKDDVAFWNEALSHETYDEFWKARNLRPHLKNIKPAVLTVGGWFDAENLFGALETYRAVEANSAGATNIIVMGPWLHGGWSRGDGDALGDIRFNSKTGAYYRETIEFPFFQYYLKGKGDGKFPEAWMFETGTNLWRKYDSWPPKAARPVSLNFQANGKLSLEASTATTDEKGGFDEYISDPAKPVPYLDKTAIGMAPEYMVGDQRSSGRRTDVLTYTTDVLASDVTLLGKISAELFVSTTGTDADWIVKLVDVYPDDFPDLNPNPTGVKMGGYQQLVRGEVMRGKFRNSYEKPEPFKPSEPTTIRFTIPDINHTFRPGHRIMVQIHSTWFPLVDRNPQTFMNIPSAKASDFKKATQRVYFGGDLPSQLKVMLMEPRVP